MRDIHMLAAKNRQLEKSMTSTIDFMREDFKSSLFPLKTNFIMAEYHKDELSNYINQKILSSDHPDDSFLPQQTVYATKPKGHLRRTVKLDPVAEYFIYDLIFRNKKIFRPQVSNIRRTFGYRITNGSRIPVHIAYAEYKEHLNKCSKLYQHNIQFDIASYFNSIYHHDLDHWFAGKKISEVDSNAAGQYFREINSGRSIDFLPQGIYPCKMIGNEFLKYIDSSGSLKSSQIVRFMDDFTLFGNDPNVLKQDFIRIQQLLGKYALNINPSKTYYDNKVGDIQETLSDIRQSLKEIVTDIEEIHTPSGVDFVEVEQVEQSNLSNDQVDGLMALLTADAIEESDADHILSFLRLHSDNLLELMPVLLTRFPNLIKHIHSVCADIRDKGGLTKVIFNYLKTESNFLEYQLFWLGAILEDYLRGEKLYGECLIKIYELSVDFKISRAKILEIPELGFGLKEIRDEFLKTGQSDWISWSSAIGSRSLPKSGRNHALNYFSKGSPMNFLVSSCVKKI
ncbi:reverse transcriptase domain-containing protein [Porticoccaceae bacterium]|nr:reverse transcriptase domain-containing protein [Porticoccaceae bacterium]MDA8663855.1 reverse transcriptase domain-containing protein [Porticoccaceae bacterium]MDB2634404.1 reverse transcriptase domain-containing protein [Porticoccaceae bacterium]